MFLNMPSSALVQVTYAMESFTHLVVKRDATQVNTTAAVSSSAVNDTDFAVNYPFSTGLLGVDQKSNFLYTNILIITFCALVAITLFLRLTELLLAHLRRISIIAAPHRQTFWTKNGNRWWPWLKQHVVYAPLLKTRHNRELQLSKAVSIGTLPSRGHMTLLITFIACNIAYCLALPYSESPDIVWAGLRGRTGILAAINMIPTILFALRNNPLIWILRTPYDTFNLFHRWLGRIAIIQAVLHTVAWCISTVRFGGMEGIGRGLSELPHGPSYVWGLVGTMCLILISIQAWAPLRHAFYETFLNLHKLLVVMTIVGVYLHLKIDNLPQVPWLQVCIGLYVGEYAVRVFSICRHNLSFKEGVTMITVEALNGEACRITAHLTRSWRPRAGTHAHIYVPTFSLWSSHPFSVAWSSVDNKINEKWLSPKDMSKFDPEAQKGISSESEAFDNEEGRVKGTVSFITRARTGMTRNMYEAALAAPSHKITTWGFVEGPYGSHMNFSSYGTLLLFAGGVGITHQTSHIRDLLHGAANGLNGCKKIVLIWSVPSTESLEWVRPWMDEILRMPGRREVLTIKLFVTRPRNKNEVKSGSGSVAMYPGRCTPQKEVDECLRDRQGAMAVTVCGPGAFADDVRRATRNRVKEGVVDFVEEAFTY